VRLADDARKCVVFFGTANVGTEDELTPWGTGFIVATGEPDGVYLITARHVVQPHLDCPFDIRFNRKSGGGRLLHVDQADWIFHPTDETVDVAVLEIKIPDWADCRPFDQKPGIINEFKFASKNIGPGDIVYTVGVWKFLYGRRHNQPFVHVGHIGLVPEDEKVPVENWMPGKESKRVLIEAYLTEGEPLDGASGSPVFVRRSFELDRQKIESRVYGSVWLLGLQQGAWFAKPGEDYQVPAHDLVKVSRGINVVVPSMKINEVLNQPRLKDKRSRAQEALDRERIADPTR
jgi:Trypsin-like peptidase domain